MNLKIKKSSMKSLLCFLTLFVIVRRSSATSVLDCTNPQIILTLTIEGNLEANVVDPVNDHIGVGIEFPTTSMHCGGTPRDPLLPFHVDASTPTKMAFLMFSGTFTSGILLTNGPDPVCLAAALADPGTPPYVEFVQTAGVFLSYCYVDETYSSPTLGPTKSPSASPTTSPTVSPSQVLPTDAPTAGCLGLTCPSSVAELMGSFMAPCVRLSSGQFSDAAHSYSADPATTCAERFAAYDACCAVDPVCDEPTGAAL